MKGLTYKQSGVDISRAEVFKRRLGGLLSSSYSPAVLKGIGGFGSFFRFPKGGYKEPVLVSSADGVGTKLKVALLAGRHDTVGIDAVAMNVNDILCSGARPLFFLDYIAHTNLSGRALTDIIKGLKRGCMQAGCSLIGGETAQMPGMYRAGEYDLAGFCVGVVERRNIIDGARIRRGDLIIGLASSGIHSNGYSLVRKVFSKAELKKMSAELLKPTRIYVKPVLSLLPRTRDQGRGTIKGIAHITGGAFYDKLARILPGNLNARIYKGSWQVPRIFRLIQQKGRIEDREIYHTFNMGIGMVLVVRIGAARTIIQRLARLGVRSWAVGEVIKGNKEVEVA